MSFDDEEVTIQGAVSIGAAVTCADRTRRNPAIVIIMGTGNLDRDGNGPGFRTDLYKNMADMFAEWGYAVIRYDKRGLYRTGGDNKTAGLMDLVDDAISVIQYAKTREYVDPEKVVVCGHSEGTMIAAILSEKEKVAGLILLGGGPISLRDALYYQNREVAQDGERMKGAKGFLVRKLATEEKGIAKVNKLFDKCGSTDKDRTMFGGVMMNSKWLREHDSYTSEDYVAILKAFDGPVLDIIGTADLSADYRALETLKGAPNIECYAPENVNHMLREIDDDNLMVNVKKQYLRLSSRPVHAETQERMRRWLESAVG